MTFAIGMIVVGLILVAMFAVFAVVVTWAEARFPAVRKWLKQLARKCGVLEEA